MKDFKGKVAFITGAAGGIGYALAEALGKRGMKVMIAGINERNLDTALPQLRAAGIAAERVQCDVGNRFSVQSAALATIAKFGKVHLVCNNAGVGGSGMIGEVKPRDWDWVIDVNIKGVVHGTEIFAPLIESHGEGGHIVNTSSMAGMFSGAGVEPYAASKYAVVAMSEGWNAQLAAKNIGVSVMCPGFVRTQIYDSDRNKPASYGGRPAEPKDPGIMKQLVDNGMDPAILAQRVIEGIEDNELYIFTHPEMKGMIEARFKTILAAMDKAAKSPALKDYKPQDLSALGGPH